MPLIKICGITDPETAKDCAKFGADFIGIVFAPQSKRYVTTAEAIEIAKAALDAGCIPVGVFVDNSAHEIIEIAQAARIDHIQAYGLEEALPSSFIRFFPATSQEDIKLKVRCNTDYLLIDGQTPGSGKAFDWNTFRLPSSPWFLAGGLHLDNIEEALIRLSPDGIDVSSGVESHGKKNVKKIQAFIEKVREYDANR